MNLATNFEALKFYNSLPTDMCCRGAIPIGAVAPIVFQIFMCTGTNLFQESCQRSSQKYNFFVKIWDLKLNIAAVD